MKAQIEKYLNDMELEKAKDLLAEYEQKFPKDTDIFSMKAILAIYRTELEDAEKWALLGVKTLPTNGDMYYNLAYVYELKQDYLQACENYLKAMYIYGYCKDEKLVTLQINNKFKQLWEVVEESLSYADEEYINKVKSYILGVETLFGFDDQAYRSEEQVIGSYRWTGNNEEKYMALYRSSSVEELLETMNWDLMHTKAEFLDVNEGNYCQIEGDTKEYLLPIATEQFDTIHTFEINDNKYTILQHARRHFNYYKVNAGTSVVSNKNCYYGNPIPLGHDSKRKKLVLNIFVDGLSQEILNGDEFEKLMPNTYKFFKKGVVCTQAYSTAEWTYPSLATYVTGLDTIHHMMFHDKIGGSLPKELPTLAEYFKEAGYYTAKFDGEWRSVPSYGHMRGYDRFVYQNQLYGARGEMIVGELIEHMEAFQDTDQFLWTCIGDLHDVADDLDLPIAVQRTLDLSERTIEKKGTTSVKQSSSQNKINMYKKMATHTDVLLNTLYSYIESKYAEDEIIVSLFADHGQGYLVPKGGEFLSKERTKVAFMFRGDVASQISDEIISTCDYISIMCKLAGITMKNVETMTNLPVCFGGEKEREYTMTESLHPKDFYRSAIFTRDYTVYFENPEPVAEDGRFVLGNYNLYIEDTYGNRVENKELYNKYIDIIMEHIAPLLIYK